MLLTIAEAARLFGVCTKTLRRWDANGSFKADYRTVGGHRRYELERIEEVVSSGNKKKHREKKIKKTRLVNYYRIAAVYARVSASKQKEDLARQVEYLKGFALASGYEKVLVYKDIASGINDKRSGLRKLIKDAFKGKFDLVYITHTDRLARFGISLINQVFDYLDIPIINVGQVKDIDYSPEYTLVNDVLSILTSYSGRLYRLRRGSFS
ncbi:MAG: IS607 family transposase [Candidatus Thorarchaeota archaeon]